MSLHGEGSEQPERDPGHSPDQTSMHFGEFVVAKTLLIAAIVAILVQERGVKIVAGAK